MIDKCVMHHSQERSQYTFALLQGKAHHVQADSLVAADGASSRVRKQPGNNMTWWTCHKAACERSAYLCNAAGQSIPGAC